MGVIGAAYAKVERSYLERVVCYDESGVARLNGVSCIKLIIGVGTRTIHRYKQHRVGIESRLREKRLIYI